MFNQIQLTTSSNDDDKSTLLFLRFKMINFEILSKLSRTFVGKDENKRMKLPLSYVIRNDKHFHLLSNGNGTISRVEN